MLSEIFKAYDVRGVYKKNLDEDIAYKIGKAFVTFLKCKDVVVGYDMRLSSPALSRAFMAGANDAGADAIVFVFNRFLDGQYAVCTPLI